MSRIAFTRAGSGRGARREAAARGRARALVTVRRAGAGTAGRRPVPRRVADGVAPEARGRGACEARALGALGVAGRLAGRAPFLRGDTGARTDPGTREIAP